MGYNMDYSTPITIRESGADAFNAGVAKSDCPISSRTHANAIHWWNEGWDREASRVCTGKSCAAKRRGEGHSEECNIDHDEAAGDVAEIFPGTREALSGLSINTK